MGLMSMLCEGDNVACAVCWAKSGDSGVKGEARTSECWRKGLRFANLEQRGGGWWRMLRTTQPTSKTFVFVHKITGFLPLTYPRPWPIHSVRGDTERFAWRKRCIRP